MGPGACAGAGAGVLPNIGVEEVERAGALPPNIGAELLAGAGAGAALESPVELLPNLKAGAGVDDEVCPPKEKPPEAGAGAGAPPNDIPEGADSPSGLEPKVVAGVRLPEGAGAEAVLPKVKAGAGVAPSSFPSRLRLLRSSFSLLGTLPSGTDGLLLAVASADADVLPKENAGFDSSFFGGSESAGSVLPKVKAGFTASVGPEENRLLAPSLLSAG